MSRQERSTWSTGKSKNHKIFYALLFFFVLITITQRHKILLEYGKWLSPNEINPSDSIIVSQGAVNGRLDAALRLYVKAPKSYLITVATTEEELAAAIRKHGILDIERIYMGECISKTTLEDANNTLKVISDENIESRRITVVSDKYVLRRIRWVFRHVLGKDFQVESHFSAAPDKAFEQRISEPLWWRNKFSRRLVFSETQKLLFYQIYYGVLGKDESWDIPYTNIFDWFKDVRSGELESFEQRRAKYYKNVRAKCYPGKD